MNLNKKFFDNKSICPLCGKELTLFLKDLINSIRLKGTKFSSETRFKQFQCIDDNISKLDLIFLTNSGDIILSQDLEKEKVKDWKFCFFYLCQVDSLRQKLYGDEDYDIDITKACYYRSSPTLQFPCDDIVLGYENFSLHKETNDGEKVFFASLNYVEEKLGFWYYFIPNSEKENPNFEPPVLEKTFPLPKQWNFDKNELIKKFESWVIMA